jgi:serine/threonine protein kinase
MPTFHASAFHRSRGPLPETVTEDIEVTCDLVGEHTADLAPGEIKANVAREVPAARPVSMRERAPDSHGRRARSRIEPHISAPMPLTPPAVEETAPEPAPPRSTRIEPGAIVNERFLIERQIGTGGNCAIYRARDMQAASGPSSQARIALKTPHPNRPDRAKDTARLRREFECLQALSHPNIVRAHELHCDDQQCFMTLELLEGKSLARLQREWMPFPTALAYRVLEATGRALIHAHQRGVVHGDFTPGNVLVTPDEQVKVLDFGSGLIAAPREGEHAPAGTRAYASPEVLAGQPPEPRDDLYSFACLAYELLVGRHPFDRKSSVEACERELTLPRSGSLAAPQWFALVAALAWKRNDRSISLEALLKTLSDSKPAPQRAEPPPSVNRSFATQAVAAARYLPEQPLSEDIWPRRNWGWMIFAACAAVMVLLYFR